MHFIPQTDDEVLALTGADKDETDAMRDRLIRLLEARVEQSRHDPPAVKIQSAARGFARYHPDAVCDRDGHRTYSDDFRDFVLEMMGPGEPGEGMPAAEMALATGVPLETLEAWIRLQSRTAVP